MKLLQVNVTANWGSTGKIAEQINSLAQQQGWETYIAYGRYSNESKSKLFHVGSKYTVYEHYIEHILFDNDGLASRCSTRRLVKKMKEINPDIIHLHNIHDHWVNYRILFEYLKTIDTPIVWTQHDCWSFTGNCGYYTALDCTQWMDSCSRSCPYRKGYYFRGLINRTKDHFNLKNRLFTSIKNLTLVPVSRWLENEIRKSFLKDARIKTIYNGIDVNVFKPLEDSFDQLKKYGIGNIRFVVGVASVWSERKGFLDYCKLSRLLPEDVKIVLVGLNETMCKIARDYGIIGIGRTDNINDLVAIYNKASIVMNLSYEETFGLTTVEGFACGTPSIVYNSTASPELISTETGLIVEPGDIEGVAKAVAVFLSKEKPIMSCRKRAIRYFNKEDRYKEYVNLYSELIRE